MYRYSQLDTRSGEYARISSDDDNRQERQQRRKNNGCCSWCCCASNPETAMLTFILVAVLVIIVVLFLSMNFNAIHNVGIPRGCVNIPDVTTAGLTSTRLLEGKWGKWKRFYVRDVTSPSDTKLVATMKYRKLWIPNVIDLMDRNGLKYGSASRIHSSNIPVYRCKSGHAGYLTIDSSDDELQFKIYNASNELVAQTNGIPIYEGIRFDTKQPMDFTVTDVHYNFTLADMKRRDNSKYRVTPWDIVIHTRPKSLLGDFPLGDFVLYIIALAQPYHFA